HLVLTLPRSLDRAALARSLELLASRHPILGCTVDADASGARWRPGTTAPALVWDDAAGAVPALDARTGPTCRAIHESTPAGHRLRFGVHHAITDGVGVLLLADDLRRIYCATVRGEDPRPDVDWSPRTIDALLDAHGIGIGERVTMAWAGQRRWAAGAPSTHADAGGIAGAAPPRYQPVSFSTAALDTIVASAGARGWRPSHLLLAALAVAWSRAIGPSADPMSTSGWLVGVNARRPLHTVRGAGNLSGFEPVALRDVETRPLAAIVDDARDAFAPFRTLGAGMLGELGAPLVRATPAAVLNRAMTTLFETQAASTRYTRAFSAVEIPDHIGDWGDSQADAAWCEPVDDVPAPSSAFVLTTFRGTVTCSPGAAPSVISPDEAAALFTATNAALTELAGSLSPVARAAR
ncbi:MAG TPA: hypothetical protein VFZ17_04185, partial [Acidimicrobiia bacterium]|nr:hypothetical protein [Acidimicrobiia bacterium]